MRMLVVCHDAGGAEVVAAWLKRPAALDAVAVVAGPAGTVFARELPRLPRVGALPALDGFGLVLCGSSGAASLERRALVAARAAGVRSAVWLDHWTAYAERLTLDGRLVLPDEVWVCDEHAARLAEAALPGAHVVVRGNPYLEEAAHMVRVAERHERAPAAGERILYVAEPTSAGAAFLTGDAAGLGYDELDALAGYLEWLAARPPAMVRVRPHPAEPPDRYDALIAAAPVPAERSAGGPLALDIAWADTVAGCESMALVVALHAGRRVVSVIPPGGRPLSLPFSEIERVF